MPKKRNDAEFHSKVRSIIGVGVGLDLYNYNINFKPSITNVNIAKYEIENGYTCSRGTLSGRDEVYIDAKNMNLKHCIIASNGTVTLNIKDSFECVGSYIKGQHVIFNELQYFSCNNCQINSEHITFNTDYIDLTDTTGCYFTGSVSFTD